MALSARRKLILAKIETTPGTAVATVGADAVLITNPTITPLTGGTVDRGLVRPYYGASDQIPVNSHQQLEFETEIAGPGSYKPADAAIGIPGWGKLLRACGFSETAGKKATDDPHNNRVDYAPISGSEPSLTVRANSAGQQHVLAGCRGSVVLRIPSSDIPRMAFRFLGRWTDPSSVAAIAPDYSTWPAPRPGSNVDTPVVSFLGQSNIQISSIEIDMGVEVVHREIIGAASDVIITDRAPSGTIVMDAVKLSAFNPFTTAREGATGALRIVHGGPDTAASAGTLVEINCPKVQLGEPSYGEDNGVEQWSIPFTLLPDAAAGNDEIQITAR